MIIIDLEDNDRAISEGSITFTRQGGSTASLTIMGLSELRTGDEIRLTVGARVLGDMYVHLVTHELGPAGYTTQLELVSPLARLEFCPLVINPIADSCRSASTIINLALAQLGADVSVTLVDDLIPSMSGLTTCGAAVSSALQWSPRAYVVERGGDIVVGEAGTSLSLHCQEGELRGYGSEDGLISCAGVSQASLQPRVDLVPPCVSVVVGSGLLCYNGDIDAQLAPYSTIVHLPGQPSVGGDAEDVGYINELAQKIKQKEYVRGTLIPKPHSYEANYSKSLQEGSAQYSFWKALGAFPWMGSISPSALVWGELHIAPQVCSEVFDSEDEYPANYELPNGWTNVYLHTSGVFKADANASYCTPGLHWCKSVVEQNVYALNGEVNGLTAEEVEAIFTGDMTSNDGTRYKVATLRVTGVLVDRQRVAYYPLTNADEDAADEETEDEGGDGGGNEDYVSFCSNYYAATRAIPYDGSLTLEGVVPPSDIVSYNLNIEGLVNEWEAMNTPIQQAIYNMKTRSCTLKLGSREIVSIDEMAARRRSCGKIASEAVQESVIPTIESDEEDEEPQIATISPSYNANYAPVLVQRERRRAWQVYADGDNHYIAGGYILTPNGRQKVDDKLIPASKWAVNRRFIPVVRRDGSGYSINYRYYDTDND